MIIADLISVQGEKVGRAYLSEAPFPGDTIITSDAGHASDDPSKDVELLVIRRSFLDLGPNAADGNRTTSPVYGVSLRLKVRLA